MCNKYRQWYDKPTLAAKFNAKPLNDMPLRHDELFPKRRAAVIRKQAGELILDDMVWGFPPPATGRAPVTNVRNLQSPFWRNALSSPDRRCLVPAAEFCEWNGEKGSKQEHWFSIANQDVFAFAGVWRPKGGDKAFAFLTCGYLGDPATHIVGKVHAKAIPVILQPEDYNRWLDGDVDEICALAEPFPSQLMKVK